jgi:prevent-host-death family protein
MSHMKPLQLQEAKQQFSAVAERAARGQPQIVTKHGKPFVVVVSVTDWQEARPKKRTLLEMLRSCPVDTNELDFRRSKEFPHKIALCTDRRHRPCARTHTRHAQRSRRLLRRAKSP